MTRLSPRTKPTPSSLLKARTAKEEGDGTCTSPSFLPLRRKKRRGGEGQKNEREKSSVSEHVGKEKRGEGAIPLRTLSWKVGKKRKKEQVCPAGFGGGRRKEGGPHQIARHLPHRLH